MQKQNATMNDNEMELIFDAISSNEGFARVAVAAFVSSLNPTLEEISDIKTAVSEAVTNAIIHGYEGAPDCYVEMALALTDTQLVIEIRDQGVGIADIGQAMEPLYTSRPELERSGMGFLFMEAFMDEVQVESEPGKGTCVTMKKWIGRGRD